MKRLKGEQGEVKVSKQAFSQARGRLKEEEFIRLNEELVKEFYTDNEPKTWRGYRVIGIDGSTVQLPKSEEIEKEFGEVRNQFGAVMAMGRISAMFDVEDEITIDAVIDRYTQGERELLLEQIKRVVEFDQRTEGHRGHKRDLFLFDMGYPALYLMVYLMALGKDFVMRTNESFLKEVQEAIQREEKDVVIRIRVSKPGREMPKELKELVGEIDPKMVITVRVIKLELPDGKQEILLTTLLDVQEFRYEDFQGLYGKRWGSETNYDVWKNVLEIENFTGLSARSVRQDFHATVLTNNIWALVQWDLKEEIEAENRQKSRKYEYKLNTNLTIGRLKDKIVKLVLEQGDLSGFYEGLKKQMKRDLVPIRPGRRFPRKRRNRQKYTMNKKRAL